MNTGPHNDKQTRFALKYLLILLAAAHFSLHANAQTFEIQARIIDSSNFEPVSFSTVYGENISGTISDEQGFFRMQIPREYYYDTLYITCIGYTGNSIPINNFKQPGPDSIYLHPNIIELDEVEIQTKSKRTPKSKEIIKLSLLKMRDNYPLTSILYNGYYREYIKKNDDFINLFESIINLEDPGFQSIDNFQAGLMFKRINRDFRVDSMLMRPYDNRDKFIPYSRVNTVLKS